MSVEPGVVRPMTSDDLARVLAWRNHVDIRQYMFNSGEITPAEHIAWFRRCRAEPGRHLLMYEQGGCPAGFANLGNAFAGADATWGFYVAPASPRGTGTRMCRAVLAHAFADLRVARIHGEAIAGNPRSIALHEHLGFRREGLRREPRRDGSGGYHDVVRFGLAADAWRGSCRPEG